MAKGQKTSDDIRAAAMAALLAGQRVGEVAAQLNVSAATVSRIKQQIPPDQLKELETRQEETFGDLLAGYLRETITTLREQAIFFRNKTWLFRQSASEVAVLHGVCADKGLRLLEAIERSNEVEETTETPETEPAPVHSEGEPDLPILQTQPSPD
ncbi:MAG TPA: helix-turn-helix domain-containing protein [Blastocatellia bacterium]|nr:helix-turn-helix domain-containing protein [Blastocatellia bacterium]